MGGDVASLFPAAAQPVELGRVALRKCSFLLTAPWFDLRFALDGGGQRGARLRVRQFERLARRNYAYRVTSVNLKRRRGGADTVVVSSRAFFQAACGRTGCRERCQRLATATVATTTHSAAASMSS
jgi:hypothetical protein